MHPPSYRHTPLAPRPRLVVGIAAALLMGACASTPKAPTAAPQAAQQAIDTADRARVPDQASPELHEARDRLAAAQLAVQAKDMDRAERLAQESRVDAELALAMGRQQNRRVEVVISNPQVSSR